MGWQDRPYYRDRGNTSSNPLNWILYGTVPLFTAFGIRVQAHASLILMGVIVLLLGWGSPGFGWQDRVGGLIILFGIILLHEFGHCFTARWVGGSAEDILMHPLGGVALCSTPRRPLPAFLTSAGGPAVNVIICALCGMFLWQATGHLPTNPFYPHAMVRFTGWFEPRWLAFWIYQQSWTLLIFNLLPIFPLDGGQMTQAILWKPFGYYRSMMFSCIVGMIASGVCIMASLATMNLGLAILAGLGFSYCFRMRRSLLASGYEADDGADYSAAYDIGPSRRSKPNNWFAARREKLARQEAAERVRIDAILSKVSAHGMHSLNWFEKRALRKATEHQRQRDAELSRVRRG